MQCDSHISETDVTSTDNSNEEKQRLGNVLRGRHGDRDAKPRGSHRMIGQSVCIYEKSRIGMQALEMRYLKRLDKIPRDDDG